MKCLVDMDIIVIDITNACMMSCSNCTRFCGHQKPYFMSFEQFKEAIDSMINFPGITGLIGGEPLLHPQFEKFCKYALTKIPREHLGLLTSFPRGYENYRKMICRTFGSIFLNDHTKPNIYHCPVLVAIEEVVPNSKAMFLYIDHCWVQEKWSASINPNGAFFCEVAGAMSILFNGNKGWKVEKDWYTRTPKDYTAQIEEYCPKCGCAAPLPRRPSIDGRDDISPGNLERLEGRSFKIKKGKYVISDLRTIDEPEEMWTYRDHKYRSIIANRYGIYLTIKDDTFHEPHLKKNFDEDKKTIFEQFQEKYKEARP
jgi:hypothetical protein